MRLPPNLWRGRLLIFFVAPAVCIAVVALGYAALQANLQIENVRKKTVFDAIWSIAAERVDRLDKLIIAQDNVVAATVDEGKLASVYARWLPTAERETPSVRAIVVLDASSPNSEVRTFVSRRPGPEDNAFRRLVVHRILARLDSREPRRQLRHLHQNVAGRSYLLSYWHRRKSGREYLVIAWHDVALLVHQVIPRLYQNLGSNSRMNVVDQRGRILYGTAIAGGPTVGLKFPTTLYNWRLNVALTRAEGLEERVVRQRFVQLGVVGLAILIVVLGTIFLIRMAVEERRLAALRGDFVANVSHELKTPLASVRMFSEMLLTGRVPNEEKRKRYLQIIVGESERLSSLIDNVLDFAKVERGKAAYDFRYGDTSDVVLRAVEVLGYRAEGQGVEICVEANSAPCVHDGRALELALINLIDNALKYAEGTQSIVVSSTMDEAGERVVLSVRDDGPGISLGEQVRIFDRFVRGKESAQSQVRGSGIGLALVKHIAEAHGGKTHVLSPLENGRGAEFKMSLPV